MKKILSTQELIFYRAVLNLFLKILMEVHIFQELLEVEVFITPLDLARMKVKQEIYISRKV